MAEKKWEHHEMGKELSNWGRWGEDDEIGTLNYITDEVRVAATKAVKTGRTFEVGIPFDNNGPWLAGGWRRNPLHTMTLLPGDSPNSPDGQIAADDMIVMGLQSATQWDGLAHVGYEGYFYNGIPASAVNNFQGASKGGFEKVAKHLIGRCVLLDLPRAKGVDRLDGSYQITAADLDQAEAAQGVKVQSGDIVLLRTGWQKWLYEGDKEKYMSPPPGPVIDMCPWLHERQVSVLTIDQWAGEVFPSPIEKAVIPFHQVAIRDMGLTLGEIFDFEALADDCAKDGVYEGFFAGPGLKVTGAVGSPTNPVVIK